MRLLCFAVVAVLGVQMLDRNAAKVAVERVAERPGETEDVHRASVRAATMRPAMNTRLNSYLVNHNEHMATGLLPYVRIVGYDAGE